MVVSSVEVALVLVLGLLAVLASTAFAVSPWMIGDAVKPRVTRHEYLRAQHQLTLPPGVTWPQFNIERNSIASRGARGGRAVGISQNAWECYWVRAIDRGDIAGQRRAHGELEALLKNNVIVAPKNASENWTPPNPPKVPYAVFADDGGYQWVQAMYKKAAAGDASDLRSSCREQPTLSARNDCEIVPLSAQRALDENRCRTPVFGYGAKSRTRGSHGRTAAWTPATSVLSP